MTTIHKRALLACVLVAGFAAGATLSAQDPPPPPPPAESRPAADPEPHRLERRLYRHPILRIAQNYTLPAGETVRAVQTIFGDAYIDGHVDHDVVVIMGSARLGPAAVVDRSLAVFGGSATIDQGATIGRDLIIAGGTLTAPETFSPDGHHVVIGSPWLGAMLENVAPWITRGLLWGRLIVPGLDWVWAIVGIFFLLYLALNTVFDRPVGACADALTRRPLSMFLTGLLVLMLAVPLIVLVGATVIGLVLVPFIVCALIVAGLVGKAGVLRAIGRSVLRSDSPEGRMRSTMAFAIGFGLLTLAYMVPVFGFVTWALTTVLGFGAATVTFRNMLRRERPAPEAAPVKPSESVAPVAPAAAFAAFPEDMAVPADAPAQAASIPIPPPIQRSAFSEGLAQYPRATFLDRVAAFALDAVLVAIAGAVLDLNRYEGYYLLMLLAYHIVFWAWRGTTLGGIICNLRVIRTHGAELRFVDALVRGLTSVFSIAALGIGCFWMLQDDERQMWHDKIAGTLVVKVPRDLVLP
ncbi:MAG TPA: RDD family protein [Vicinamibacterales bacterium]|nr:RDD family protein [Vicinamibacterales bacterium]